MRDKLEPYHVRNLTWAINHLESAAAADAADEVTRSRGKIHQGHADGLRELREILFTVEERADARGIDESEISD